MEDEFVTRRRWLSREEFLDLVSASNVIPGPSSTELAIHIGHRRAGFAGLVVAGACFILPAVAAVLALAWVYREAGSLPAGESVLRGVKPVVAAIVADALWRLARTAMRTPLLAAVAAAAFGLALTGVFGELVLLAGAGAAVWCARKLGSQASAISVAAPPVALALAKRAAPAAALAPAMAVTSATPGAATVFFVFAKIGSLLFGSGYVLLAFLRTELVLRRGWLTEAQLLDAVSAGQITPGPLFSTATFIGYQLGGVPTALAATAGIFAPAFLFVAITAPLVPHVRRSLSAAAFLDGFGAASIALMTAVSIVLARSAITGVASAALALAAFLLLVRFRVNAAWLVLGGGVIGSLFI